MTLSLREIHAVGPDRYEVTFVSEDGTEKRENDEHCEEGKRFRRAP